CFFLHHPPPSELHPLSLHDALPIWIMPRGVFTTSEISPFLIMSTQFGRPSLSLKTGCTATPCACRSLVVLVVEQTVKPSSMKPLDRKSTRLNSSHVKSRMPSSA